MTYRTEVSPKVDRGRHPALFQRVSRSVPPVVEATTPHAEPLPAGSRDLYAAFVEFVQFRPAEIRHRDERGRLASARLWDFLEAKGFHPEEIHQLKFGVYTTPEDVRGYLRSVGFSEAAIAESGLVADERGIVRHDWQGGLLVPLHDERGQLVDVLAIIPTTVPGHPVRYEMAKGAIRSGIIAYGLSTALASSSARLNLVLVEDVLDALYLQCRGFENVAAVGADGREFSSPRWEELARLGVEAVTLAFGNDATRQRDVREALDNALRARTAPEVFTLERTQFLNHETLADVARRHGLEACRKASSAKSLAFHGKDFGWSAAREAAPRNGHAVSTRFHRENYRAHLRTEAEKIAPPHERATVQGVIAEIDEALSHRHFSRARAVLEARLGANGRPRTWREAPSENLNTVLDRLCDEPHRSIVPESLSRYEGNELLAGTVTVLMNESVRGRLADLCSRLVTALETRPEQTWVVVCREFSQDVITLGLIAQMTRRMTTAQGLTFEEIQARLSGRDPLDGYSDKPWLVDEALDRLRRWTDRVQFVIETPDAPRVGDVIERLADQQGLGGVFFDAIPDPWSLETNWGAAWKRDATVYALLREWAARWSCAMVVVTEMLKEELPLHRPGVRAEFPPAELRAWESNPVVREFRDLISYWIDQEERLEVRVA